MILRKYNRLSYFGDIMNPSYKRWLFFRFILATSWATCLVTQQLQSFDNDTDAPQTNQNQITTDAGTTNEAINTQVPPTDQQPQAQPNTSRIVALSIGAAFDAAAIGYGAYKTREWYLERQRAKRNLQLREAAKNGNDNEAGKLIQAGVDINALDDNKKSALDLAAASGHIDVVKRLLKESNNKKSLSNALLCAAQNGHVDVVMELAERVKNSQDRFSFNEWSIAPLSAAAKNGHVKVAKALIDAGAGTQSGRLVRGAVEEEKITVLKTLLDAGANTEFSSAIDFGETALHLAVKRKNREMVKMLLDAGANVKALNNLNNTKPIEIETTEEIRELLAAAEEKQAREKKPANVTTQQKQVSLPSTDPLSALPQEKQILSSPKTSQQKKSTDYLTLPD